MKVFLLFCLCLTSASQQKVRKWAVLVAGCTSWRNLGYSCEANVCHAYQILHKNGIPDEQIITMFYDSDAYDPHNKYPGTLYSRPKGPNVYKNALKDYTKEMVTPENFLKVLQGIKPNGGSGKVIESGPNDHVFVYFIGHGGSGVLLFPNRTYLHMEQLHRTLANMYKSGKYGKLVFYLASCESGSMFRNVSQSYAEINVLATTGSDYNELLYATCWDNDLDVFHTDEFSLVWMDQDDTIGYKPLTLEQQYKTAVEKRNRSHPQQYGKMEIDQLQVSDFIGASKGKILNYTCDPYPYGYQVSMREADLVMLKIQLDKATTEQEVTKIEQQIKELMDKRKIIDKLLKDLVYSFGFDTMKADRMLNGYPQLINVECHENAVEAFVSSCNDLLMIPYAHKFSQVLGNLCDDNSIQAAELQMKIKEHCEAI